jgi:hypothetical protein
MEKLHNLNLLSTDTLAIFLVAPFNTNSTDRSNGCKYDKLNAKPHKAWPHVWLAIHS